MIETIVDSTRDFQLKFWGGSHPLKPPVVNAEFMLELNFVYNVFLQWGGGILYPGVIFGKRLCYELH